MVSIRRRRLLGLSTGMTPVPSIDLDQVKETGISNVHPGSSNVSTFSSSKEQQQFSGDQNITSDGCPNSDAPDSHQNYSASDLRIDSSAKLAVPSLAGFLSDSFWKNHIAYVSSANTHIYLTDGVITIENSDLQIDLKAIFLLRSNVKAVRDQADKLRDDITRDFRANGYILSEKLRVISDSQAKLWEELTSLEDQINTAYSELEAIHALLYQRMGENSTK